jgi:hypothetical protein
MTVALQFITVASSLINERHSAELRGGTGLALGLFWSGCELERQAREQLLLPRRLDNTFSPIYAATTRKHLLRNTDDKHGLCCSCASDHCQEYQSMIARTRLAVLVLHFPTNIKWAIPRSYTQNLRCTPIPHPWESYEVRVRVTKSVTLHQQSHVAVRRTRTTWVDCSRLSPDAYHLKCV